MRKVEGTTCELCGSREAVVLCDGCEKAICAECRHFDIWCHGCGSGDVKAFCPRCYDDPEVNLYRAFPSAKDKGNQS